MIITHQFIYSYYIPVRVDVPRTPGMCLVAPGMALIAQNTQGHGLELQHWLARGVLDKLGARTSKTNWPELLVCAQRTPCVKHGVNSAIARSLPCPHSQDTPSSLQYCIPGELQLNTSHYHLRTFLAPVSRTIPYI